MGKETIGGKAIIYDETVQGTKYILLDSGKPGCSEVTVQWMCSDGATLDGNSVRIPNEILSRMAAQVSGEGREVLLDATSDQVIAYLRDNLETMHSCLEDPVRLPALIASVVTVLSECDDSECDDSEYSDSECDGNCDCCCDTGCESCEFERESLRKIANEEYDTDIIIDVNSPEFLVIRYAIRVSYEMLRKEQVRELEKKRHGS